MKNNISIAEKIIVSFICLLCVSSLSFLTYKSLERNEVETQYYASLTSETGIETYKNIIMNRKTENIGWVNLCALPIEQRTIGSGFWQAISYNHDNKEPVRLFCFSVPLVEKNHEELVPLSIPFKNDGESFLKEDLQNISIGQMFVSGYGRSHYVIEVDEKRFKLEPKIDEYEISRKFLWVREQSGYFSSAVVDQSVILNKNNEKAKEALWNSVGKLFENKKK